MNDNDEGQGLSVGGRMEHSDSGRGATTARKIGEFLMEQDPQEMMQEPVAAATEGAHADQACCSKMRMNLSRRRRFPSSPRCGADTSRPSTRVTIPIGPSNGISWASN